MTDLARGANWLKRACIGLAGAARSWLRPSSEASARAPNPLPAVWRNWRRDEQTVKRPQCWLELFMAVSVNVEEFIHAEQDLTEIIQGERFVAGMTLRLSGEELQRP